MPILKIQVNNIKIAVRSWKNIFTSQQLTLLNNLKVKSVICDHIGMKLNKKVICNENIYNIKHPIYIQ